MHSKISGFVNGFSSFIVISDGTPVKTDIPANYMIFPAEPVEIFEYIEARELPLSIEEIELVSKKHGFSSLSLVYADGVRLSIFER